MKKIQVLQVLFGVAVAGALAACNGAYKSPDVEVTTETGQTQLMNDAKQFEIGMIKAFPDIPIPSSHKIDLQQSIIFTSPTQTMGKVVLTGSGDADSLYRFFEDKMAEQGWNMVNAFQSVTSSMYFAKPGRFVAIIIESTGKNSSRIFLNVGPE